MFRLPWRRTGQIETDVDDEIRFHVHMRAEELIAAGTSPDEAWRRAETEFGDADSAREYCRAQDLELEREDRRMELMSELRQDAAHTWRTLRRSPGFALVALATLALGIGANTAVFSVVNAVLFAPLPYRHADRIVRVFEHDVRDAANSHGQVAAGDFVDWRASQQSFAELAAFARAGRTFSGPDGAEQLPAIRSTANFFETLGVEPLLGRTFREGEDGPGGAKVVILGHSAWQRLFGGDPSVVGKAMRLADESYTVIGVLPPRFTALQDDVDIYIPMDMSSRLADPNRARKFHWLAVVGRLKPGVSAESAHEELLSIARRLEREYPESNTGHLMRTVPLRESLSGPVRPALLMLLGAAGFVLLIACANVANLVLSRAVVRRRELAIRAALGAGRGRLMRQMITESVLLSLAGGVAGLLLALVGTRALLGVSPELLPPAIHVRVDWVLLGFTMLVALVTGTVFGLAPALSGSRADLREALRDAGRGTAGPTRSRFGSALLAVQVALSVVLLVGTGLLIRSVQHLQGAELGYDPGNLLTFRVSPQSEKYDSAAAIIRFYEALRGRLSALPGVVSVGETGGLPLLSGASASLAIEGRPVPEGELPEVGYFPVSPAYFRTMGVPLVQGRWFDERDTRDAPRVILINAAAAKRFWPAGDAIGARVRLGPDPSVPLSTVVGVVGSIRHSDLISEPRPSVYPDTRHDIWPSQIVVLRTGVEPASLARAVRREVRALDPDVPVIDPSDMSERIDTHLARRRFAMLLLATFACLALLLAAVGVYGVIAYAVSMRTREFGVRIALGAQRRDVLRLVLRQGTATALAGVLIGLAGAAAATRLLTAHLHGVRPLDTLTFSLVPALLVLVIFAASLMPARRATRVDPVRAMRSE